MEAAKLSKDNMETMGRERLQMRGAPFFPLPRRQEDRRRIEDASSKIYSFRTKERHCRHLSVPHMGSSSKRESSRPASAMGCRHGSSMLSPEKTMAKTQTSTHHSSTMLSQSRKDSSSNKRKQSAPATLKVKPKSKSDYSHIQSKIDFGRPISSENTAKKKLSCGPVLQHCRVSTSSSGAGSETKCCTNLSVNSRELKRIKCEATSRIDSRDPFPQVHRMTHTWKELTETGSFLFNIRFLSQPNLMASLFRRHSFSECETAATLERKKAVLVVSSHRKWNSMEDLHVSRSSEHLEGDPRQVSMTLPTGISRKQMFGEEMLGKISNERMSTDAERHFLAVSESESDEEATDHENFTGSHFVDQQGQPSITTDLGVLSRRDLKATTEEQNSFTPPTNEKGRITPPTCERWSLITPPTYKSQGRKISPTKQKQDLQTKHPQRRTLTVSATTTCGTNKKNRSTKQQLPLSLRRYSNV